MLLDCELSTCFCSVTKSCLTLGDPVDCSMPGSSVLHYLPEFAQIHVHWVGDAIQPSHPLPSSSPFAFNLSQHQGLLQWISSSPLGSQSIGASSSASVLPMNILDWFPLGLTGLISLQSKGLSRVFSSITIWKHQFFSAQPSLWSNLLKDWHLTKVFTKFPRKAGTCTVHCRHELEQGGRSFVLVDLRVSWEM